MAFTNLIVSSIALGLVLNFADTITNLYLPESPKALNDLQKVFIPPMRSMQILVLSFDVVTAFYYMTTWPVWDNLKRHVPFFQTDLKTMEKADCSNLLLMIIFVLMSKVSSLFIV